MGAADTDSNGETRHVQGQIAAAVKMRRSGLEMTQEEFAKHLGNGTSVDIIKKIESGSKSAPSGGDAASYAVFRCFPEVAELIDRLPTSLGSQAVAKPDAPSSEPTEISLLPLAPLTEDMIGIVTSSRLVVAFASLGAPEFEPRLEAVEGRVIERSTIEIRAPIFDWDTADKGHEYLLRWQHRGPGYFGGYVLSPMGVEMGQSVLELSDQLPGFSGGTLTHWNRHGFAVHVIGLAADAADARHCAQLAWDDLTTPTGQLLGSGDSIISLRAYSPGSESSVVTPETER